MQATSISRAVLVTGCSSGIGRATALRLAAAGWPVYASARRVESIRDLAPACRLLPLDVTVEDSMRAAVEAVEREAGAVGVLVNNAGYSQSGAVESVPMAAARRQMETNFLGPARLTQLALPGMRRQRWGRVVNVSSIGGRVTFPGGGFYHASKYALEALSDALRFELRPFGVAVVLVEPGLIRSGFAEAAVDSMGPAADEQDPYASFNAAVAGVTRQAYERGLPSKLGGGPEDVARVIQRAIEASRPRPRYLVTPSARVVLTMHRLLPGRLWDRVLRSQYPEPG
jgi:NAD(P)-dependent dehydrogenase (short-subunit alcohol dehydrogenase family)